MYRYTSENCDVLDKKLLIQFRNKRKEWLDLLNGNDPHSIWNQIHLFFTNAATFGLINELRKNHNNQPNDKIGFNNLVIQLFDIGFITYQANAIRRQNEKQSNSEKKSIISLRALIEDIINNISIFTRENYVGFDGLPFDYEKVRNEYFSNQLERNQCESLDTHGPNAWAPSEDRHETFNQITDSKSVGRKNLIKKEILENLLEKLNKCEEVCSYVHKFIGHGAHPNNRKVMNFKEPTLTLAKFDEAYKNLYQVANYLSGTILCSASHSALPSFQYDHLENLDKGWIFKNDMQKAHEIWQNIEKKYQSWM